MDCGTEPLGPYASAVALDDGRLFRPPHGCPRPSAIKHAGEVLPEASKRHIPLIPSANLHAEDKERVSRIPARDHGAFPKAAVNCSAIVALIRRPFRDDENRSRHICSACGTRKRAFRGEGGTAKCDCAAIGCGLFDRSAAPEINRRRWQ